MLPHVAPNSKRVFSERVAVPLPAERRHMIHAVPHEAWRAYNAETWAFSWMSSNVTKDEA